MSQNNEWSYKIQEGKVSVISYLGSDMEVEVPSLLEGFPVTCLEKYSFYNQKNLSKVYLPATLEHVGEYAFSECRALCEIELPASLIEIRRHAFYNCRRLKRISLFDMVENIEDGAFKNCYEMREIRLFLRTRKNIALRQILYDINHEMTVEFWEKERIAKLQIPQYSSDAEIDINSRAFHEVIHGLGSMFRDWVSFQYMNFEKYDAFFEAMVREERQENVFEMAVGRLQFPYEISEKARKQYENYLEKNIREFLFYLMKNSRKEEFSWGLKKFPSIKKELIDSCMDVAVAEGKNEFTVLLMAYRRANYKKKEKSFEL